MIPPQTSSRPITIAAFTIRPRPTGQLVAVDVMQVDHSSRRVAGGNENEVLPFGLPLLACPLLVFMRPPITHQLPFGFKIPDPLGIWLLGRNDAARDVRPACSIGLGSNLQRWSGRERLCLIRHRHYPVEPMRVWGADGEVASVDLAAVDVPWRRRDSEVGIGRITVRTRRRGGGFAWTTNRET
jgi:hypothetical protein